MIVAAFTAKTVDVKNIESGDKFWIDIKGAENITSVHLDLKTAKNLLDTGFQLIKTTDQFYFLQLIDFNLDILQDNWIPLYQLLQESKEEKDPSPVYIYSEKQQTTFFDQNKEEPKEKPVRKRKTATKTTSEI